MKIRQKLIFKEYLDEFMFHLLNRTETIEQREIALTKDDV